MNLWRLISGRFTFPLPSVPSKAAKQEVLEKLVRVGLTEVIMGIQSGSDRVRREVFHRYETREEILRRQGSFRRRGCRGSAMTLCCSIRLNR